MESSTDRMSKGEARLSIISAGLIFAGKPKSSDPEEVARWAEYVASQGDAVKAIIQAFGPLDQLVQDVIYQSEPAWFYGSLEDIEFKENAQRYALSFIKRDPVTGMPVDGFSNGKNIGNRDSGSTHRLDSKREDEVRNAHAVVEQAESMLGRFVQFQKMKDPAKGRGGYNLIVGLRAWMPESLQDQDISAVIAAVETKKTPKADDGNNGGGNQQQRGYNNGGGNQSQHQQSGYGNPQGNQPPQMPPNG